MTHSLILYCQDNSLNMYIRGADHHVLTKKGRLSVIFGYSLKLEQLKLARRQVCPRLAPTKVGGWSATYFLVCFIGFSDFAHSAIELS